MNKIELFVIGAKKLISDNFTPSVKSLGKGVLIYLSIMVGFAIISQILGWVICKVSQTVFDVTLRLPNGENNEIGIGVIVILASVVLCLLILYLKEFINEAIAQGDLENTKKNRIKE